MTIPTWPSTREDRQVIGVIVAATIARLVLGWSIGLGVDESYAVAVSHPLSLSYYDHPPAVFTIVGLTERLAGVAHPLLLRLPFILLFAGTTWLLYGVTRGSFGPRAGVYAAVLLNIIPVFAVSDGGWILPDGPLLCAFAAAALCLSRIATAPRGDAAWNWWIGLGAAVALALLSKYHAVFLIAGVAAFLLTTPSQRRWLTGPQPYVALAVASVGALPMILWNADHRWVSFRFQGGRAHVSGALHITSFIQNLGGQIGYVLPWIWIPLVIVLVKALRAGRADARRWLFVCLGTGPIVVFTLLSLGGSPGLPHWPAPGFFLIVPLLADALAQRAEHGEARRVSRYLWSAAAVTVLLVAFAASQVATGWFSRAFPGLFERGDPSLEALDWSDARPALDRRDSAGRPMIVVATNWIDAAKLGAALGPEHQILCFNDDARHFRYATDQRQLVGRDALLVLRNDPRNDFEGTRSRVAKYFGAIDSLGTIAIDRFGHQEVQLVQFRVTALAQPFDYPDR